MLDDIAKQFQTYVEDQFQPKDVRFGIEGVNFKHLSSVDQLPDKEALLDKINEANGRGVDIEIKQPADNESDSDDSDTQATVYMVVKGVYGSKEEEVKEIIEDYTDELDALLSEVNVEDLQDFPEQIISAMISKVIEDQGDETHIKFFNYPGGIGAVYNKKRHK